ncbi:protein IQ-DOMAIN 32-like protein [Cinnamomum micranthum f. kanehirae]|uniref:Protein IQ-DOMAIN 32-like protein n=1 Tax=Cinnamomum micranthum f. kanehirae TaxID=337451 RepID=A0A443P5A8_9MAGN|nr:protein IQ-DOMAIN 32-like protein [Cinnamomum micranthum f. kanehirae]
MAKTSCFNLIACGSDSAQEDEDHLQWTESRASVDRHGWSFRKRSTRHQVLSNALVSEVQSAGHKGSPEAAVDLHVLINPTVPEKISVSQWKDDTITIPALSSVTVNSKVADTLIATGGSSNGDYNVQECVAIAKKASNKLKTVVKLQAVVRGHLVRRQAVGTLCCIQAIVKMQALVRARRARLSLEGLSIQEKLDRQSKIDHQRANPLEYSDTEGNKTNASVEKLVSSRFARQLLESKPKTKPIHISCDPARPESAWKWLEKWMSVLSSEIMQLQKLELNLEHQEDGAKTNSTVNEIESEVPAEVISKPADMNSGVKETEMLLKGEENSDTCIEDDFEFQAWKPIPTSGEISSVAMRDDLEDGLWGISPETATEIREALKEAPDSVANEVVTQSTTTSQTKPSVDSDKPEVSSENSKQSVERVASEQVGTEGKKFIIGSRKSTNSAFAAVRSKFEELSSGATSSKSISSSFHDTAVESRPDSPLSYTSFVTRGKDLCMTEELISHDPRIQMWGSECGTELSISSTLDSPDRPEAEGGGFVHEIISTDTGSPDKLNSENLIAKAINSSSMLEIVSNSSYPGYVQPGKLQEVDESSADSVSPMCPSPMNVQPPSEQIISNMHAQVDTETDGPVEISPQGSPRSNITVPDSHGTPSSQFSQTSSNRKKSGKSPPSQKHMSQSVGKRSISKQSHDSTVRSSTEHLSKDPKIVRRRNSFDHEQRVSSSTSNSLPSYMQVTKSARAKANMNHSPKLSPDVQDKESHLKKRHSLPFTAAKQGFPRMQLSIPHVQQGAKEKAAHSPQTAIEKKWQR